MSGGEIKILHINSFNCGGGAESVFNITRKNPAVKNNYSGFIQTGNYGDDKPEVEFVFYSDSFLPLRPVNYFFSLTNMTRLYRFLKKNKIHVVHLHGFIGPLSSSILLVLKIWKKRYGFKIVQTLHDFHIACPNSLLFDFSKADICTKCLGKKIKLFPFVNSCDRRGLLYSIAKGIRTNMANLIMGHKEMIDAFIAPSALMKTTMLEEGLSDTSIKIIRNPIQVPSHAEVKDKINAVCHFGRFSKEKNISFIITAFENWKRKSNNDFSLLLIGGGEEDKLVNDMVEKSVYKKDIALLKFMPFEELAKQIVSCKYFVMASRLYENAPMSILEAVSLNIIPVVPNLGGMKETVESVVGIGGVYDPDSVESFVECMENLEFNYSELSRKLTPKINSLISKYNYKSYYSSLNELYLNLF